MKRNEIIKALLSAESRTGERTCTNGNFTCSVYIPKGEDPAKYLAEVVKYRSPRQNTYYMHKETETSKILGFLSEHRDLISKLRSLLDSYDKDMDRETFTRWNIEYKSIFKQAKHVFKSTDVRHALSILPPAWN